MRFRSGRLFVALAFSFACLGAGALLDGVTVVPRATAGAIADAAVARPFTSVRFGGFASGAKQIYTISPAYFDALTTFTTSGTPATPQLAGLSSPSAMTYDANGKLYVCNAASGTITTYDAAGVEVEPTIFELNGCSGVAVDKTGKIYVVIPGTNSIQTYTPTGVPTKPVIQGLGGPVAIALDASGKIYVANQDSNMITTYTSAGVQTTPTIPVIRPSALAIGGTGKIYVGTLFDVVDTFLPTGAATSPSLTFSDQINFLAIGKADTIYVTSRGTLSTFTAAGIPTTPVITPTEGYYQAVAVDKAGDLHVADLGLERVDAFTPSGKPTTPNESGLNNPTAITVDATGKIYVATAPPLVGLSKVRTDSVTTYTTAGVPTTPTITSGLNDPSGIAVNSTGKIFVTNLGNNTLTSYTAAGVLTTPKISGLNSPSAVAVDSAGKIYIANAATGMLTTYTSSGARTTPTISLLFAPSSIAVDSHGRIYVVNPNGRSVTTYTPTGQPGPVAITGLKAPTAVSVDAAGTIYVTTTDFIQRGLGAITMYTSAGTLVRTIPGLTDPIGIAVH